MELVLLCIAATCFSQHIDFLSPLCRAAQDELCCANAGCLGHGAIAKPSAHTPLRRFPWFCERKGLLPPPSSFL